MLLLSIGMGITSAITFLILLARINLTRFMGYPILVDVLGTVTFVAIFHGTLTGMLCAVIAGLSLSGAIAALRYFRGYERWHIKQGWVYYPPRKLA